MRATFLYVSLFHNSPGTNYKLFSIEKLDGEKVVSRSRGFTVDTCVSAVDENMESPEFQVRPQPGTSTHGAQYAHTASLCPCPAAWH